jgi:dTDP-4-amino-4,6-dideoxygalactose transaminase
MHIPFLDLKRQYDMLRPELDEVIREVLAEQRFVGGPRVASFEQAFARAHQVEYCIGVGNATDALFIILKALGIGPGDEVIVPAHGWLSAAEMVLLTGARPVFADVCADSYCIDPSDVEARITEHTRAIIPIHLYGQMADMESLQRLTRQHDILVIEDCAQAHFASQSGRMAGGIGVAGAFSFYPSKLLGAMGDGGCITTNDKALADKCRALANHGGEAKNEHQLPGLNSRLDTLQAAILECKLQHAGDWITGRNHVAGFYDQSFSDIGQITRPQISLGNAHNFHLYVLRVQQRDELKAYLESEGIQTEIHYPLATPFTPAFAAMGYKEEDFPNCVQLQSELLSIPVYATMTHEEVMYIVRAVSNFYKR